MKEDWADKEGFRIVHHYDDGTPPLWDLIASALRKARAKGYADGYQDAAMKHSLYLDAEEISEMMKTAAKIVDGEEGKNVAV